MSEPILCQRCGKKPSIFAEKYGHVVSHVCKKGHGVTCCFKVREASVAAWNKSQETQVDVMPCMTCDRLPVYMHDKCGHTYAHICDGVEGMGGAWNWPTRVAAARAWDEYMGKEQQ